MSPCPWGRRSRGWARFGEDAEGDSLKIEQCVEELSKVMIKITKVAGGMFEQDCPRLISMCAAAWSGGSVGVHRRYSKGIMDHRVIRNLEAVIGDKS